MMKRFNTSGVCIPEKHYMVNINNKLEKIIQMVEYGDYFTINRARQYGKTTTLRMLQQYLPTDFICINISFEGIDYTGFENPENFCQMFLRQVAGNIGLRDKVYAASWQDDSVATFEMLGKKIRTAVSGKKVVLMIDEVDKTSNNRIFFHFLGMLRSLFLTRADMPAFHSVILAGVYDIKNIKLKLEKEGLRDSSENSGKILNSPWNIATDFEVDMSFNPSEISTMLVEYEADHHTGMDIDSIANEIYKYTSGYPFLVSRLCQLIKNRLNSNWKANGVRDAVKIITTTEKNTLYDELFKNLQNNRKIYKFMYDILILGDHSPRDIYNPEVEWSSMLGFITIGQSGEIRIANKIFETMLIKHFITSETNESRIYTANNKELRLEIVKNGVFDIELLLQKFAEFFKSRYKKKNTNFYECHSQLVFLAFLQPLINGHGFFHIESETADEKRMDIILDYGVNQYIIELKIWHGDVAHAKAHEQLLGYMESKNSDKGYLLTFDLRTEKNKQTKAEWVDFGVRRIYDVIV